MNIPLRTTIINATIVEADQVRHAPLHLDCGLVVAAPPAGAWELDLRDHLIFPGLINAHDHLHLNSIPSLPQSAPFSNSYQWIAAFQDYFADPRVAAAVAVPKLPRYLQGGLKNLLAGATTVAHHDPWHAALDDPAFAVSLLRDFGWSHSMGLGIENEKLRIENEAHPQFSILNSQLPRYGPPVEQSFAATPANRPWIIHLAEGTDALAAAEMGWLDRLGCLAANTVLVHGVGLTAAHIERVIERGAAVVWCPGSNLAMLGRTLGPRRLADAGRLALGSDSRLTGARDLLDELRVAAAQSDLTPGELLRITTKSASSILRMPEVGGLSLGQRADMLIARDAGGDPLRTILDITRVEICAVARGGVPMVADPQFAGWFDACGVETVMIQLDGLPKLLARSLAHPAAIALEPGLDLAQNDEL